MSPKRILILSWAIHPFTCAGSCRTPLLWLHQYYCLKAAKLLKPLGILAVIVPASFLADSFSDKGAIRMMESRFSFLGQVMLPEHAFSDSGVDGQIRLCDHDKLLVKRGRCHDRMPGGNIDVRAVR